MAFGSNKKSAETVVIVGLLKYSTSRADLVFVQGKDCWLPNSQYKRRPVMYDVDAHKDAIEYSFFIPLWLAEAKDLNYEEYDPADYEEGVKDMSEWDEVPDETGGTPDLEQIPLDAYEEEGR